MKHSPSGAVKNQLHKFLWFAKIFPGNPNTGIIEKNFAVRWIGKFAGRHASTNVSYHDSACRQFCQIFLNLPDLTSHHS